MKLCDAILGATVDLANGELGKSQDVLVLMEGTITLPDGTLLRMDEECGRSCVDAFAMKGVDMVFDWEHAQEVKAPQGEPAPATGWGKKLWYEKGVGLKCRVEWNDDALEQIKARKYRYLSPALAYEKDTGRVRRIRSMGLVNQPATPRMPALAASIHAPGNPGNSKEASMKVLQTALLQDQAAMAGLDEKLGKLKALLEGMTDNADANAVIDAALSAISKMKGDAGAMMSVRQHLKLPDNASKEAVIVALSQATSAATGANAELSELRGKIAAIESQEKDRKADALLAKALSEHKLNEKDEAQMKAARTLATNSPDEFTALMSSAKPFVAPGKTAAPDHKPAPSGDEDKLIEKALSDCKGNTREAYAALQRELIEKRTATGEDRKHAVAALREQYPKIFG